jgi:hypothetical protein
MRLDLLSLASGAVIAALGALVLLESSDAVDVSLGWMAVALSAGLGAIFVVSGLAGRAGNGHDSSR